MNLIKHGGKEKKAVLRTHVRNFYEKSSRAEDYRVGLEYD